MSGTQSGIRFQIDATEGSSRRLHVGLEIEGPFTASTVMLHFPRWVPGSYFLREPIQHMTEFSANDQAGQPLKFNRVNVDAMRIVVPEGATKIHIHYRLLANDLSVRSNHLDESHLHMMPPFTWFLPTSGVDAKRMNTNHTIEVHAPSSWIPATQYELVSSSTGVGTLTGNKGKTHVFTAPDRDELLDGIIEINPNENQTWVVEGRTHHLKLWDSGGHPVDEKMLGRFKEDMDRVVKEHHALFGIPKWDNYVTVIQLTEKARGGLEHLNSQTSMLPRQCLMPGHEDEYRDLISLYSHEYLHQWNVKRLRPRSFLDYDLQKEGHSDLLWWFEGGTSWLGDMLCVRSGAWTEEDWRKDFTRKMKRHTTRHGMAYESLTESSHDAWIHLYRGHAFSRESQISYYLEGELTIMELDMELRKRSKGLHGVCDLMALLCQTHALECDPSGRLGVTHKDIRKALVSMKGGGRLGVMLDELVNRKAAPDMEHVMGYFGLKMEPEHQPKEGQPQPAWLGLNLSPKAGRVVVSTHMAASPLRLEIMPGDEIVAIDGLRTPNIKSLETALKGKAGQAVAITYAHEGIIREHTLSLPSPPHHNVKLVGKGNNKWRAYIATRQTNQ
jgi:predicted metalloprotease with PDZ domain